MAVWAFAPALAFVALLTAVLGLVAAAIVTFARWLQASREHQDRPE
jgi:hypothetical protein